MKTLQNIKDELAKKNGWLDYESVIEGHNKNRISSYTFRTFIDDLINEVSKQSLKNASDKLEFEYSDYEERVDYSFITDENNIPKP